MPYAPVVIALFAALLTWPQMAVTAVSSEPNAAFQQSGVCTPAIAALERGEIDNARDLYLDALASDDSTACAIRGLRITTKRSRSETKLCAEGNVLAEDQRPEAAERRYIAALRLNATSECAKEGLAPPSESKKDEKSALEKASTEATSALTLIGSIAAAGLVLAGLVLIAVVVVKRRHASLTVEPFSDGGIEPKVGSAVAALVETSLTDLARKGRRDNASYVLDTVVADIELVATNKSLETALGGLTEASQLKLVIGVLALVDRLWGTHLVVKGELAPKGGSGHGIILALQSEKDGLQAREALWKKGKADAKSPKPYYEIAEPAAGWVQYEAARSLDPRVALMTTSAKSFSRLTLGLTEHRAGRLLEAAEKYAEALTLDRENVAAMFNLSVLLARDSRWAPKGTLLLIRALTILQKRYEELE